MNELDMKVPCPKCLADPGQQCFIGDGLPTEVIHLSRRVARVCSDKSFNPEKTKELIDRALDIES